MKYYLLQRGHSHSENTLHAFYTAPERDTKTIEVIFGPDGLGTQNDAEAWDKYREELNDTGNVEFEGDPGLEWFTAHAEMPEPKGADLHVRMALSCLEELEPEAMRRKQRIVRNFNEHTECESQLSAARVSLDLALAKLNP